MIQSEKFDHIVGLLLSRPLPAQLDFLINVERLCRSVFEGLDV